MYRNVNASPKRKYEAIGIEILIALYSEAVNQNPLHVFFVIMPVVGAIFWSLTAYMFMRVIRTPYPGLAVAICLLALLFLTSENTRAPSLIFLHWGKSLVETVGAPLLFFSVAVFLRSQNIQTWLLLLFSVCTTAIWSSTALFLTPASVCLAIIVFLPSIKDGLPALISALLSLTPILLLLTYGLLVLHDAPVNFEKGGSGPLKLNGDAFGGTYFKFSILIIILSLPLIARTVADAQFQRNILRLCMVGYFTVMAPYLIEAIVKLTNLNLLSFRLPSSFPFTLLTGLIGSIVISHFYKQGSTIKGAIKGHYLATSLVLISYGSLLISADIKYLYGESRQWAKELYEGNFNEAAAARALIPEGSVVAAGYLDDAMPMLPAPPAFISVRHYLKYHKNFLSENEFSSREYIHRILKARLPKKGESLETALKSITSKSDDLGVTTLVFQLVSGWGNTEPNPDKANFVIALTKKLTSLDYHCSSTPSGRTMVCNREL